MTKVDLCDVCLSEGKFGVSKYRHGYPGKNHLKISLCERHKNWAYEQNIAGADGFDKEALSLFSKGNAFIIRAERGGV